MSVEKGWVTMDKIKFPQEIIEIIEQAEADCVIEQRTGTCVHCNLDCHFGSCEDYEKLAKKYR